MARTNTVTNLTSEEIAALVERSIKTMPNSPSSKGYAPEVIKARLVDYILDTTSDASSLINFMNARLTSIKTDLDNLYNAVSDGFTIANANITSPTITTPTINGGTINKPSNGTLTINTPTINTPTINGATLGDESDNEQRATLYSPVINDGTITNASSNGGTITNAAIVGGTINATGSSRTTVKKLDFDSSSAMPDVTPTNLQTNDASSNTNLVNQKYVDVQVKKIVSGEYVSNKAKDYTSDGTIDSKFDSVDANIDAIEEDIGDMSDLSDDDVVTAINTLKEDKANINSLTLAYNTSNGNINLKHGTTVLSTIDLPSESVFVTSGTYAPSVVVLSSIPYLRFYLVSDTTHESPVDINLTTIFSSGMFSDTTTIDYDCTNSVVTFKVKDGSIDYTQVSTRLKTVIDKVEDEFGSTSDTPSSTGSMWARFLYTLGTSTDTADSSGSMWARFRALLSTFSSNYTITENTRNSSYSAAEGTSSSVAGTTSRWAKFYQDLGTSADTSDNNGTMWARYNYQEGLRNNNFSNAESSRSTTFTTSQTNRETEFNNAQTYRTTLFTQAESSRSSEFTSAQSSRATSFTNALGDSNQSPVENGTMWQRFLLAMSQWNQAESNAVGSSTDTASSTGSMWARYNYNITNMIQNDTGYFGLRCENVVDDTTYKMELKINSSGELIAEFKEV